MLPRGLPSRGLWSAASSEILRHMGGVRQAADTAKNQATDALKNARVKTRATPQSPAMGPRALIALQRSAGNAAINALMAGRLRFPGKQATAEIDSALREIRRDEPVIDTVEKGLKAAKAAGVPVDLEGVRPPASALAVKTTGFGPGSVPAKKPVPPPKKVPAVSPLGRAAAKKAAPAVKPNGGAATWTGWRWGRSWFGGRAGARAAGCGPAVAAAGAANSGATR